MRTLAESKTRGYLLSVTPAQPNCELPRRSPVTLSVRQSRIQSAVASGPTDVMPQPFGCRRSPRDRMKRRLGHLIASRKWVVIIAVDISRCRAESAATYLKTRLPAVAANATRLDPEAVHSTVSGIRDSCLLIVWVTIRRSTLMSIDPGSTTARDLRPSASVFLPQWTLAAYLDSDADRVRE